MSSRRVLKIAEAVREVVAMSILRDIQDPRVRNVTITRVEISGDLRLGKIYVSIMGSEKKQEQCLQGLQRAAGFFQHKVADRIQTRYTPKLTFHLDKGVKHSVEVARILRELLPVEDEDPSEEVVGEKDEEITEDQSLTAPSEKMDGTTGVECVNNNGVNSGDGGIRIIPMDKVDLEEWIEDRYTENRE